MKIEKNVLVCVDESDLIDGRFINKKVTEVADKCFWNVPGLKSVILPKVKKIGSYCFRSNDALTEISLPVLAQCGSYCFSYNDALTEISLGKHKLNVKNVDGYCYVIDSHRSSKGFKIYGGGNLKHVENNNLELDVCYVAEKEGKTAHGQTVKQAIEDVQFKLVSEKLKNEPITPETKITVQYYRMVTGACDLGCRHWMEANNIPYIVENKGTDRERTKEEGVIMASDILPLLEKTNAYGVERFKQLANWTD